MRKNKRPTARRCDSPLIHWELLWIVDQIKQRWRVIDLMNEDINNHLQQADKWRHRAHEYERAHRRFRFRPSPELLAEIQRQQDEEAAAQEDTTQATA
jgi:hypothetical protein